MKSTMNRSREGVHPFPFGTAYAVLKFLGPGAGQFIGRHEDFIFGWTELTDEQYGLVLLLQIIPRPQMLAMMN